MFSIKVKPHYFLVTLLVCIFLLGTFLRLYGAGDRPLSVDEYYTVSSIDLILEKGFPKFDTGGYYVRGILHQYLTAASTITFGQSLFGYRLPTVVLGILSIFLTYVYARRYLAISVALAVTFILTLSSWHIEFSQFIRMYTALQCITLLFLISWHSSYFGDRLKHRYLPHLIIFLGMFVHELTILLVPLLFIPIFINKGHKYFSNHFEYIKFTFAGLGIGLLSYLYLMAPLRDYGANDPYPADYVTSGAAINTSKPDLFLAINTFQIHGVYLPIIISAILIIAVWASRLKWKKIYEADYYIVALVIFSLFHNLFVSLSIMFIILVKFHPIRENKASTRIAVSIILSLLLNVSWLIFAWHNQSEWIPLLASQENITTIGVIKAWLRAFAAWPDLFWMTKAWIRDLPIISGVLGSSLIIMAFFLLRKPWIEIFENPSFIVFYIFILVGILNPLYSSTRYMFFIYPVILCTIALTITECLKRITIPKLSWINRKLEFYSAIIFISILAITGDFNPRHWLLMADESVIFRTGAFERFDQVWYPRVDVVTPANFLNDISETENNPVTIVVNLPSLSYYLKLPHFVYYPRNAHRFPIESRERGNVHLWSNQPLLSTPEEIAEATIHFSHVWLIREIESEHLEFFEEIWGDRLIRSDRRFISHDGRIEVIEVRLR